MNLKKILSGFLAAAMAVTSMVTASAEPAAEDTTIVSNVSVTSGTYDPTGGLEVAFDGCAWSGTWMCDDYGTLEMTFSASDWGNAKCIALVINSGDALNDADQGTAYVQQTSWWTDSGKVTYRIDCSQYAGKGFNFIGYKIYRADDITDTDFNGDITIESVVLTAKDTVEEYEDQVIANPPMGTILPGTFDASKVNGKSAKVTISWTSNENNNGIQIQNDDGENLASFSGWGTIGSVTQEVLLSDFTLPGKLKLNAWGVASIESMTISNDKTKGKVYDPTPSYILNIGDNIENGTVSADVNIATEGSLVTLTVTPDEGYEVDGITVYSWNEGDPPLRVVDVSTKPYTFEMPGQNATVVATFKTAEVALTGITLNKTTAAVLVGGTTPLTASKVPSTTTDETPITWSSNKENIATVTAGGVVTGVAAGTAVITATCGEKTATCTVTVSENAIECTGITLNKTTATVEKNATVTLTATTTPADTTDDITWASSDTSIATVEDGVVTGKARGTADITVTCGTKSATCTVSVTEDKTVTAPVTAGGAEKSYSVVTTAADGTKVKTVDTVYAITEADLQCKGYTVTITNTSNGKSITREITNAYKSVTVKSAEDLGNDTFTGYFLVVRVKNVPENVTLSYKFDKIS